MALLTLSKMMASLRRARSRSSNPETDTSMQEDQAPWEDQVVIEYWKTRAVTAFAFVQGESMIASKVLDFGMEQLRLLGAKSERIERHDSCV
jgi:hypothetical protein